MKIINWCKENYILLSLIFLSFLLRIYKLDFQSPWADELFTLINSHSDKSFNDIFQALKGDVHPPLYYFIVHVFVEIFGDTPYVAKFISLLFGVGGIIALYYLGKELFNKNIALIAVLITTINHFHIFYSQEARMYTMLFFTTTLSFLLLIRFIKTPALKTALLYSLGTVLLVNTHFFGLFALCAQYLIIFYFIIIPYNTTGKKFFFYSFISGIITLISFTPSLVIFLGTSGRTSIWIPIPSWSVYTSMFTELIGSEIAIAIAVITTLYYFFKIFNEEESDNYKINPVKDKSVFAFQILFIWIFISILIPLVLSFIHLPMVISRYFINILPPMFLLIAAGMSYIKSNTIRISLLSIFVIFSLNDLICVKKYYQNITKTQYREVSDFVIKNHKKNEKIYSSFEIYFSYFLKEKEGNKVTGGSLNQLAERIISNQEKPQSFWHVDITYNNPDKLSESTLALLDSVYVVDQNLELFDAFVKHYHTKADYKPVGNFSKFKPYKDKNGNDLNFSYEFVYDLGDKFDVSGWAYFNDQSMVHAKISVVLIKDEQDIVLIPISVNRPDVTSYFKSSYDLSNSGFKQEIKKADLKPGTYKLALYVVDPVSKKESLVVSDKTITK